MNALLDDAHKLNENLDTTSHKEQLAKAEKQITEDPQKAYNQAITQEDNPTLKTTLLGTFLEKAKADNDQNAIAELTMALAEHGRRVGQEEEMIKATIEKNTTNSLLMQLVRTKLNQIQARYKKIKLDGKTIEPEEQMKRKRRETKKKIKEKLDTAFKIKDAQALLDSLIC